MEQHYARDFTVSQDVQDMLAGRLRAGGLSVGGEPLRASGRGKLRASPSRTPSPKEKQDQYKHSTTTSKSAKSNEEIDDDATLYSESTTSRKSLLGRFSKG